MGPDLVLVNTNRMRPPIAPIGLDYLAGAVRRAGHTVAIADLCLAEDPAAELRRALASGEPRLVGITLRNADDCFWPSAAGFVDDLEGTVRAVRALTGAPIALGGTGFSIFSRRVMERTGADFGIRGDGEEATVALLRELGDGGRFEAVPGLLWRRDGSLAESPPAWPDRISLETARDAFDGAAYFRLGGQMGVETKRGCQRSCAYCADHLAKGSRIRLRSPAEVAEEIGGLVRRGIDVLHLCDSEFNNSRSHAVEVCGEIARRGLGGKVRWYAYLSVTPFDAELAGMMRRAGCVGINFAGDSASAEMLGQYRKEHSREDISSAVRLCRESGIAVMVDLLLGGPGETPETLAETIFSLKEINPDCTGAALGLRIYPGTAIERTVLAQGPPEANPAIHRKYDGPIDFSRPTFYISPALGERPAELVRSFIASDRRFFEPTTEIPGEQDQAPETGYNYNDYSPLIEAIARGARGAYWDILRRMR